MCTRSYVSDSNVNSNIYLQGSGPPGKWLIAEQSKDSEKTQRTKQALKPTKSSHCKWSGQCPPASVSAYADNFHSFTLTTYHISIISSSVIYNTVPRPNYLSITLLSVKSFLFIPLTHCPVWLLPVNQMFLWLLKFFLCYLKLGEDQICYIISLQTCSYNLLLLG